MLDKRSSHIKGEAVYSSRSNHRVPPSSPSAEGIGGIDGDGCEQQDRDAVGSLHSSIRRSCGSPSYKRLISEIENRRAREVRKKRRSLLHEEAVKRHRQIFFIVILLTIALCILCSGYRLVTERL
ncbi:unnamed protein product [Phytomonas sp. EM1]|nr:unnamed protein product [Phytomonas sp. EM1]|eukprot:CCW61183.1 unnamed protein product [Phytomonas sp. isolate EM1]